VYVDTRYYYTPRSRAALIWSLTLLILVVSSGGAWWIAQVPPKRPSTRIDGMVKTAQALPVADALVELLGSTVDGKPVAYATHTAADGSFTLNGVAQPVTYVVRLRADRAGVFEQVALEVTAAEAQARVLFTVATSHTVEGVIVDVLDRPVPRARVMALIDTGEGNAEVVHGLANDEGRYLLRFKRTPTAGVRVAAAAPGFLPMDAVGGRPTAQLGVKSFAMKPLPLQASGVAEGRVVDANGKPVAGAEVQVRALVDAALFAPWTEALLQGSTTLGTVIDEPDPDSFLSVARFRTRTGPDGRFRVTAPLPCERLHLVVLSQGRPPLVRSLDTARHARGSTLEDVRELRLPPAENLRLHLEQRGNPLRSVRVRFRDLRLAPIHALVTPWIDADERGSLSTTTLMSGLRYDVIVEVNGLEHEQENVLIEDGCVLELDRLELR